MKKRKKILLILLIVILIISSLFFFFRQKTTTSEKITNYLLKNEFYKTNDIYILEKQISSINKDEFEVNVSKNIHCIYDSFLFNTYSFDLYRDYRNYKNGILTYFLSKYSYSLDKLTYTYKITSGNSNIIFSGEYDDNIFSCDIIFSSENKNDSLKDTVCDSIKYKIDDFKYDSSLLITNISLLNEMKK